MIKYKIGDLLKAIDDGEVDAFGHQTNCFQVGKRGIAPLLFNKFPGLKQADLNSGSKGSRWIFGGITKWVGLKCIGFNLYGQFHCIHSHPEYGTRYPALYSALVLMREELEKHPDRRKVGFPLIGCGLAGGDWKIVSGLIEDAFKGFDGSITVYTLKDEGFDYDLA